jgi:hypothetical protein
MRTQRNDHSRLLFILPCCSFNISSLATLLPILSTIYDALPIGSITITNPDLARWSFAIAFLEHGRRFPFPLCGAALHYGRRARRRWAGLRI